MSKKRRRRSSPSLSRDAASYIFSFLLALTFLALGLLGVARVATSNSRMLSVFDDTYVTYVHEDLQGEILDYTLPTGIPTEVLEDLISQERTAYDLQISLANELQDRKYEIYTGDIQADLEERVQQLYQKQGTPVDSELSAIITRYAEDICDIYVEHFRVPGMAVIRRVIRIIDRVFPWAAAALAVFAGLLIFLCIRLHSWPHRGLRYVTFAAGGAALMSLLAPLLVYVGDAYRRLQISPQYVYYALTEYIEQVLKLCFYAAAAWLAVTVVLLIVTALLRKKAMKS